jgi:hypothetical protein
MTAIVINLSFFCQLVQDLRNCDGSHACFALAAQKYVLYNVKLLVRKEVT